MSGPAEQLPLGSFLVTTNGRPFGNAEGRFLGLEIGSTGSPVDTQNGLVALSLGGVAASSGPEIATAINTSAADGSIAITKVAGAGWTTVMDLDFTAQASQAMGANGNYVIGGFTFSRQNAAGDRVAMALTLGTGLVIQPDNGVSIYDNGTRTAPLVWLPLSALGIPNLDWSTSLRVWIKIGTETYAIDNLPGNKTFVGVDSDSLLWSPGYSDVGSNGADQRNLGAGRRINSGGTRLSANFGTFAANAANVLRCDIPELASPELDVRTIWDRLTAVGFPAVGAANLRPMVSVPAFTAFGDLQYANSTGVALASYLGLVLGAYGQAAGNYLTTIHRLRVDYKQ